MKKEYDFSKGRRGAYNSRPKKQITIKLDEVTVEMSPECTVEKKEPAVKWQKTAS